MRRGRTFGRGVGVCAFGWALAGTAFAADLDGDGFDDATTDNCPGVPNPTQVDSNLDGYGDACVHPTVFVPASATLGWGVTIGGFATVGADVNAGDRTSIAPKSVVGVGMDLGSDGVVGRRARVGADGVVGSFFGFQADTDIGDDLLAPFSGFLVGYGAIVGDRVEVTGTNVVVGNLADVGDDATLGAGASIGRDATIGAGAVLEDGVQIGAGAVVGPNSTIRAGAQIRSGVVIGVGVDVGENARIGRGTQLEAGARVGDRARLASQVIVRAGGVVDDDVFVPRGTVIGTSAPPVSVAYPYAPLTLQLSELTTQGTPIVTNGPVTSCAISPTLPAGLSLSSGCAITGTPTALSAAMSYTVTPTGASGPGTPAVISISVQPDPCVGSLLTGSPYAGGAGTLADPWQICTPTQLNNIGLAPADWDNHFKLMRSIDLNALPFTQIAATGSFQGTFDGNHKAIQNVTFGGPTTDLVGVFRHVQGANARIKNLRVTNASLTGRNYVGLLAGTAADGAVLDNVYADGAIGPTASGTYKGGLVGSCDGCTITGASAIAVVQGSANLGGLIGGMSGVTSLRSSSASGSVHSTGSRNGGLVGHVEGTSTIDDTHATTIVVGTGNYNGGLIGSYAANARLTNSWASGNVTGPLSGGLVGYQDSGAIADCWASGNVSGGSTLGGLVAHQVTLSPITRSYATGTVTAADYAGGLVGQSYGPIDRSWATGTVSASGNYAGGLVAYMVGGTSGIANSYATGAVSGTHYIGGLVGISDRPITRSYATGNVTGSGSYRGGLAGYVYGGAVVSVFATGVVNAGSGAGALIGQNDSSPGIPIVDAHYGTSPLACVGAGASAGVGNCAAHPGLTDLYDVGSGPIASWEQTRTWSDANNGTAPPTLRPRAALPSTCSPTELAATPYAGTGTLADPYVICTEAQWLAIAAHPAHITGRFSIKADLDFSGYNYGQPDPVTSFSGFIEGNGHTIYNVRFGTSSTDSNGLVRILSGSSAGITNLIVENPFVLGRNNAGGVVGQAVSGATLQQVAARHGFVGYWNTGVNHGGVVGSCDGCALTDVSASVAVVGAGGNGGLVGSRTGASAWSAVSATGLVRGSSTQNGGLIGVSDGTGTIDVATASGSVEGIGNDNGGLVGRLTGVTVLTNASASGSVRGPVSGGLVGTLDGGAQLRDAWASGAVTATGGTGGGLIAVAQASTHVARTHATGNVTTTDFGAGLIAHSNGQVANSYATGTVVASGNYAGGLVAYHTSGVLADVYATGDVSGTHYVGGLVGLTNQTVANAYATGTVTGSGSYAGGLVGYIYGGLLADVFATGSVNFGSGHGALVGQNDGTLPILGGYIYQRGMACVGVGPGTCTPQTSMSWFSSAANAPMSSWDFSRTWTIAAPGALPTLQPPTALPTTCTPTQVAAVPYSGTGTALDPYVLCNERQWLAIAGNTSHLNKRFSLRSDLDFAGMAYTQPDTGTAKFTGVFDGGGHTIWNARTGSASVDNAGLFRWVDTSDAVVRDVHVVNAVMIGRVDIGAVAGAVTGGLVEDVTAAGVVGPYNTGSAHAGLVGRCDGCSVTDSATDVVVVGGADNGGLIGLRNGFSTIARNTTSGPVQGSSHQNGGLIGQSSGLGTIDDCTSSSRVIGVGNFNGGLLGLLGGATALTDSSASGAVSGPNSGGLIGSLDGTSTVATSSASGPVTGGATVGGLVAVTGVNSNISRSFATGAVSGTDYVAGLVALSAGTVTRSYATGTVTATGNYAGGLVGYQVGSGTITDSYARGNVSGTHYVGGLVGILNRAVSRSYATGTVSGSGSYRGGLVGYLYGSFAINDVFASGSVNAGSGAGALIGQNDGSSPISNGHILTGGLGCVGVGGGSCTSQSSVTTFYNVANAPLASWDFVNVWSPAQNTVTFPPLR
jgi:UDP-3-O-[3-hydroxymyristoyl] glucosamine N-acyltransferase